MKLTRNYLGVIYEAPKPWGTHDTVRFYGDYALSYNPAIGYAFFHRFNNEAWREAYEDAKSQAIASCPVSDPSFAAKMEYYIQKIEVDAIWDLLVEFQNINHAQEFCAELLEHVPKGCHRYYKSEAGLIDGMKLVKDHPIVVIKQCLQYES